ncbi:MAG: MarR family winged helix-turn-helix transcriptional regulator [Solirubrobacteraceae bacterium]
MDSVGFLLGVAHRTLRRQWEARLADLGLSGPQALVLRLIMTEPGCGVRQLARRIGTDPMNAQRIVESLIQDGLCESRRDPKDARRRPLYATVRGRDLAHAVENRAELAEQHLADDLGQQNYRLLKNALRTLITVDATIDDG